MVESNWFDTLPDEIKLQIAEYLDSRDLEALRRTCISWNQLIESVLKARLKPQVDQILAELEGLLPKLVERANNVVDGTLQYRIRKDKKGKRRCIIL